MSTALIAAAIVYALITGIIAFSCIFTYATEKGINDKEAQSAAYHALTCWAWPYHAIRSLRVFVHDAKKHKQP